MTDEDAKLWADRKRTVLSYIDGERARCLALIIAVDDKDFLLYCITESYTAVELEHARNIYDQLQPLAPLLAASQHAGREPAETPAYEGADPDSIEDLM